MPRERVLLLGGTVEARELAGLLAAHERLSPLTSLAGATDEPATVPGERRVGGFGGVAGLIAWLHANPVLALVDATHPFARQITAHAIVAMHELRLPYLRLERPAWERQPGDRWHWAEDEAHAMNLLPGLGRRVLVTLGRSGAERLPEGAPLSWVVRSIKRPAQLPTGAVWLPLEPPLWLEHERRLMIEQRIEVVLTKAAGGEGARAKIDAARLLGLPVVMIRRPPAPLDVPCVETAEEALAWLAQLLAARGRST